MNVSKNQVVCARCHFTGLASGIDWIAQSSADSGAASAQVARRIERNRSPRLPRGAGQGGDRFESGAGSIGTSTSSVCPRGESDQPVRKRGHYERYFTLARVATNFHLPGPGVT